MSELATASWFLGFIIWLISAKRMRTARKNYEQAQMLYEVALANLEGR